MPNSKKMAKKHDEVLTPFKKIYASLSPRDCKIYVAIVVVTLFGTALETVTLAMFLPFVDLILNVSQEKGAFLSFLAAHFVPFRENPIFSMGMLLAFLYLIKGIYFFGLQWIKSRVSARIRSQMRARIFTATLFSPYKKHLQRHSSEVQNVLVASLPRFFLYINNVLLIISEGSIAVCILAYLSFLSPSSTVSMLFCIGLFYVIFKKFLTPITKELGNKANKNNVLMMKYLQQALGDIKNIYAMRKQHFFTAQYTELARKDAYYEEKNAILGNTPRIFIENFIFVLFFLALGLISAKGHLHNALAMMAVFAMGIMRILPTATRILVAINQNSYYTTHIDATYEFYTQYTTEKTILMHEVAQGNEVNPSYLQHGIEVRDIVFSFSDQDVPLFSGVSLSIPVNTSVAFVGKTGSGKTTLADIILGLQEPSSGSVVVDGHDIFEEKDWWASHVGYVSQHIYLHDDSIRHNIAFAVPEEDIDDAHVLHCLEMANIRQFVENLPQGLDTLVGENGLRLSGGQRQRLGIARALYHKPHFLVMDEATSALDAETEDGIIQTIESLKGSMTLLIIAHRLSTIKSCDIVYELSVGKVRVK